MRHRVSVHFVEGEKPMLKNFETFSLSLEQIGKNLRRYKDERAAELGLRGTHIMLLYQLDKSGEAGMTGAKLAEACGVNRAFVSRTVAELIADGFVAYADGGGSRRYRSHICLTEKGKAAVREVNSRIAEAVELLGRDINPRRMAIFYAVLEEIEHRLAALVDHTEDASAVTSL